MDKIEKIRAEIERLKENMNGLEPHSDFRRGQITAYREVLSFIDSLQAEEDADEEKRYEAAKEKVCTGLPGPFRLPLPRPLPPGRLSTGYEMAVEEGGRTPRWFHANYSDRPEVRYTPDGVPFLQNGPYMIWISDLEKLPKNGADLNKYMD